MDFISYLSDINLNIALTITYFVLMVVFLIILQIYKKRYFMILVLGYIIKTSAFLVIYFRGIFPDFLTVVIGNVLIITSEFILIYGILMIMGIKVRIKPFVILITVFTVFHIYFTYITPSVNVRIVNFSSIMIILSVYYLIKSIKYLRTNFQATILIISLSYLIFIPYHTFRIINSIGYEEINSLFRGSSILKGYILFSIIIAVIRAASIMTFHTKKLIEE